VAFVCTLDDETRVTALHGNGEFIYRAAIGFDDETDIVYSAVVIFAPLAGYGDGTGYELAFRVVASALDGAHISDFHDGLATKPFLSTKDDREAVCGLIHYLVAAHIDDQRPPAVEMMTHTENLPHAALLKFHRIAALFGDKGYAAGPADPWHGRWVWMMRLP
jgi:hypothetical protein